MVLIASTFKQKLGANVRSLPAEQVLFMLQALLEDRF